MGAERLVVEYERRNDGAVVLRVRGRLEHTTAAVLEGVLRGLSGEEPPHVVLDLTGVDHIDSYGLDVLLETEADGRDRGTTVEVIGIRRACWPTARRSTRPSEPTSAQYSRYARQVLTRPHAASAMKMSQRIAPRPPSSHIRPVATSVMAASATDA
jgi:anti-anti-sigma factor